MKPVYTYMGMVRAIDIIGGSNKPTSWYTNMSAHIVLF